MHRACLSSILAASFVMAPLVSGADAGLDVWAAADSVRVDPVGNRPFENNPRLFPDGIQADYKQSSLTWDGKTQRIMF